MEREPETPGSLRQTIDPVHYSGGSVPFSFLRKGHGNRHAVLSLVATLGVVSVRMSELELCSLREPCGHHSYKAHFRGGIFGR